MSRRTNEQNDGSELTHKAREVNGWGQWLYLSQVLGFTLLHLTIQFTPSSTKLGCLGPWTEDLHKQETTRLSRLIF